MIYKKRVTATHNTDVDRKYVWTDNSEQTLEQWKAKIADKFGDDFTFSGLEDNPEISKQALIKAEYQKVLDPAVKKLLKLLLKDYVEGLE